MKNIIQKTVLFFSKKNQKLSNQEYQQFLLLQKQYPKAKQLKKIINFQFYSFHLILENLEKNKNYKHNKMFLGEISYFVHYIFLVMLDDFFYGDKFFQKRMTKFDEYIFSQYRKKENLRSNIKKLTMVAYSNRFSKNYRENFLSHFVFIEESGIEFMLILQDFYQLLELTQSKNIIDYIKKYTKNIYKSYIKKEKLLTNEETIYTIQPSYIENTTEAQYYILKENLKKINKE